MKLIDLIKTKHPNKKIIVLPNEAEPLLHWYDHCFTSQPEITIMSGEGLYDSEFVGSLPLLIPFFGNKYKGKSFIDTKNLEAIAEDNDIPILITEEYAEKDIESQPKNL